jgi:Na+/proline symporter
VEPLFSDGHLLAWTTSWRIRRLPAIPIDIRRLLSSRTMYLLSLLTSVRYNYEVQTSEMFSTAGRTVRSGLVASAVVSSWTWAATLLQSSSVAYRYGVSGPFWYAAVASVQIILFATIAIELKRRAPNAHTFPEVIRARYGSVTHVVYIVFGLMTNILVTSMLLTGGSAVVTFITGVPTVAACFCSQLELFSTLYLEVSRLRS